MLFCDEKCDLTYGNSNKSVQYNLEKIFCPCWENGVFVRFRYPGRPVPAPPVVRLPAGSLARRYRGHRLRIGLPVRGPDGRTKSLFLVINNGRTFNEDGQLLPHRWRKRRSSGWGSFQVQLLPQAKHGRLPAGHSTAESGLPKARAACLEGKGVLSNSVGCGAINNFLWFDFLDECGHETDRGLFSHQKT